MTPRELSLIKARYFRTILNSARPADDAVALRLLGSLTNDTTTSDVAPDLFAAEKKAIETARQLAVSIRARKTNVVAAWSAAGRATQTWLDMFAAEEL